MEKKSIFESKEQYLTFIENWKKAANDKEGDKLTFQHFILYALLRGKDWKKCLSEHSTEDTKYLAAEYAETMPYKYLSLWPFGGTITESMLEAARGN